MAEFKNYRKHSSPVSSFFLEEMVGGNNIQDAYIDEEYKA